MEEFQGVSASLVTGMLAAAHTTHGHATALAALVPADAISNATAAALLTTAAAESCQHRRSRAARLGRPSRGLSRDRASLEASSAARAARACTSSVVSQRATCVFVLAMRTALHGPGSSPGRAETRCSTGGSGRESEKVALSRVMSSVTP